MGLLRDCCGAYHLPEMRWHWGGAWAHYETSIDTSDIADAARIVGH
jgi:hypothetical protein